MTTVYDPEGNAVEVEPVDAREYVEHCGYTYEAPQDDQTKKPIKPIKPKNQRLHGNASQWH
ncbi:MAG: hypothetical protein WAW61_22505 [Methylococcaceae bacterium]